MQGQFTAVIAPAEEGGYYAYCLEIPAVGAGQPQQHPTAVHNFIASIHKTVHDHPLAAVAPHLLSA